jgi:hypothetical protein
VARSSDYNAWHAGCALAQDRVDCLGDLLGADLLEAVCAQNFLFFCDLGNLIITLALGSESALLFSWQAVSLIVFQSLFTIDLASAWLSDHHWIGGTEFMFDPHLPLLVRVLSLFHMVTPVILVWAVWRLG